MQIGCTFCFRQVMGLNTAKQLGRLLSHQAAVSGGPVMNDNATGGMEDGRDAWEWGSGGSGGGGMWAKGGWHGMWSSLLFMLIYERVGQEDWKCKYGAQISRAGLHLHFHFHFHVCTHWHPGKTHCILNAPVCHICLSLECRWKGL